MKRSNKTVSRFLGLYRLPHRIRGSVIQRADVRAIWRDMHACERDARNGVPRDCAALTIGC